MSAPTMRAGLLALLAFLAAATLALPVVSRAAASHDACTGYIDALPVVISAPGVWCLRADLVATPMPPLANEAIALDADNVTIDCNGHRVTSSGVATAVFSLRANATVRDCGFSGFDRGVRLFGHGGRIEGNRFERVKDRAVHVQGNGIRIVDNVITDMAGATSLYSHAVAAIEVDAGSGAVVAGNVIDGVVAPPGSGKSLFAILVDIQDGAEIRDNHVSGLIPDAGQPAYAIFKANGAGTVAGNSLFDQGTGTTYGVGCEGQTVVRDNTVVGFATHVQANCIDAGGNVVAP